LLWKNKSIATILGYTPEQPLTFTSPLSRSVNAISIPVATTSVNGYLSSTDWTTFNSKVGGTGTSGQIAYWNGTNTQTGSATLTYSPTTSLLVNNSVTAASLIARGVNLTPTLVAAANSDVLVGLDVAPTFTNGAFTGVSNIGLRVGGTSGLNYDVANQRLGIGKSSPVVSIDAVGALYLRNTTTGGGTGYGLEFATNSNLPRVDFVVNSVYVGQFSSNATDVIFKNLTSSGAISFMINNATTALKIFSTGNTVLQNGGTFTDGGQRLQVTGTSYFSDSVGIGATSLTGRNLLISKNITGATISYGAFVNGFVQSDVTTVASSYGSQVQTIGSQSITYLCNYYGTQGTIGASSTISVQIGYYIDGLTAGTNVYGFQGAITAATGRWNLYMSGTANNYMAGSLGIGTTSLTGY